MPTLSEASGRESGRPDHERALGTAWRAQAGAITPRLDWPPGGWDRVQHRPGVAEYRHGSKASTPLRANAQALAPVSAVAVTAVGTSNG